MRATLKKKVTVSSDSVYRCWIFQRFSVEKETFQIEKWGSAIWVEKTVCVDSWGMFMDCLGSGS